MCKPVMPPSGEKMPQTLEYFILRAERDQELILEQKAEIESLKCTVNDLRQKLKSRRP